MVAQAFSVEFALMGMFGRGKTTFSSRNGGFLQCKKRGLLQIMSCFYGNLVGGKDSKVGRAWL